MFIFVVRFLCKTECTATNKRIHYHSDHFNNENPNADKKGRKKNVIIPDSFT